MAVEFSVPNQPNIDPANVTPADAYTVRDMRATHPKYADNWTEWVFLTASYEGVRQLVRLGVIKKHEREDTSTFVRRMSELYGFNFPKIVVELVNFYLFKKEPKRTIPEQLSNDWAWKAFLKDCNRCGEPFSDYIADQARWAAVMGHVGFLVDKPNYNADNRAEEKRLGIYPYLSAYHPPAILDWEFERDLTGKYVLTYLKLKENTEDGINRYRLWWLDEWRLYEEPTDGITDDQTLFSGDEPVRLIEAGPNRLGEIPFVFMNNLKGRNGVIGVSDIHEIARIDLSCIRDLSQINEIVGYNAFPMLLAPMYEEDEPAQDDAGPRVVYEFDPDKPNAKPEWMIPAAADSLEAIWNGIDRKAREIYRIANAGGLQAQGSPSVTKSGVALAAEFQQLNAKIIQKAVNAEQAENQILYFWLKWQRMEQYTGKARIERSRDYDVHNLAQDLADALTAKTIVRSKTFQAEVEKNVAKAVLPTADDRTMIQIESEIDAPRISSMNEIPTDEDDQE